MRNVVTYSRTHLSRVFGRSNRQGKRSNTQDVIRGYPLYFRQLYGSCPSQDRIVSKENMANIEVRNNCMFFLRDQAVDYRYNL